MSGGKDSKHKCVKDWGEKSYTALLRRFKNEDGSFKRFVIATDSEFGPSWPAREHSDKEIIDRAKEVDSSRYKDGVFKYKALTNVKHLDVDKQHNGNVFTYLRKSRIYSYHKLERSTLRTTMVSGKHTSSFFRGTFTKMRRKHFCR